MATLTLPVGPQQSQQEWYAGARQGIHTCGIKLFGGGLARPRVIMFTSVVREKGSLYALAVFRTLLEDFVDLSTVSNIQVWSDGGSHFRCGTTISSLAVHCLQALMDAHAIKKEIVYTVSQSFGVPCHFKNDCDREFAYLRGLMRRGAARMEITEIKELVDF